MAERVKYMLALIRELRLYILDPSHEPKIWPPT